MTTLEMRSRMSSETYLYDDQVLEPERELFMNKVARWGSAVTGMFHCTDDLPVYGGPTQVAFSDSIPSRTEAVEFLNNNVLGD